MKRKRSAHPHDTGGRAPRALLWACGALVLAIALFALLRHKADTLVQETHAGGKERPSAYVNRSFWDGRGAAQARGGGAESPAIKGIVYDIDGRELRDAVITAMTFEIAGNIPQAVGSTRTDELGRFELPLRPGTYQIAASLEDYGPASAMAHTGESISLVLPRSGVIEGHVVDERGDPVTRFAIDVVISVPGDAPAPPPIFSRRISSLDGSFRVDQLPLWDVMVRATAEGYAPAYSEDVSATPGETTKVELKLTRGCTLSGRVEDAAGKPVSGVLVDAEARFGSGAFTDASMQTAGQVESERDGTFQLPNAPTGTVLVRGYDGAHAVTSVTVEVADCAKIEPVKLVMTRGGSIAGVALDGRGAPIPGAILTLSQRAVGFVSATTDDAGRFRFAQIPAGTVRIELKQGGRSAQRFVDVVDGSEVRKDISLFAGGTGSIRGRITADGKPLSGMQLMIAAGHNEDGIDARYPITAADGTYRVDDLPSTVYLVSVLSSSASAGVRVKADEVATANIDVASRLAAYRAR